MGAFLEIVRGKGQCSSQNVLRKFRIPDEIRNTRLIFPAERDRSASELLFSFVCPTNRVLYRQCVLVIFGAAECAIIVYVYPGAIQTKYGVRSFVVRRSMM